MLLRGVLRIPKGMRFEIIRIVNERLLDVSRLRYILIRLLFQSVQLPAVYVFVDMLIGHEALQFLDVFVVGRDDLANFMFDFLAPAVLPRRQHHAILAIPQSLLRILQLERMHIWHICSQLLFLGRFHFRKWYLAWSLECRGGKCTT